VVGGGSKVAVLLVVAGTDVVTEGSVVDVTAHSGWSSPPTHAVGPASASSPAAATAARRTRVVLPWCTGTTLEVVPFDGEAGQPQ
jgi:hypothetical protein